MSDDVTFRVNRQALERLVMVGGGGVKEALQMLGGRAELEAKALAPVDTGNLRRSITHDIGRDLRGIYMVYGTNVYYGIYQELGTRFHAAQPFLRPVLDKLKYFLQEP